MWYRHQRKRCLTDFGKSMWATSHHGEGYRKLLFRPSSFPPEKRCEDPAPKPPVPIPAMSYFPNEEIMRDSSVACLLHQCSA